MRFTYSVSFEYRTELPDTVRGVVSALEASTANARAVREARKVLPYRHPCSIVTVLTALEDAEER